MHLELFLVLHTLNDVEKPGTLTGEHFLTGEEGRSPFGCLKPLQKEARQKAFSLKEGLSTPKRSKPLGFVIFAQHIYEAFVIDSVNQNQEMRPKFLPEII